MAEFLVVFVVTLLVIGGVALAMVFGRTPVYRPDTEHAQTTLTRLLEQQLTLTEWEFFISMPIHHDADLEALRLKCFETNELHSLRPRNGHARLKEEGLIRIRFLLSQLENDGSKTF